MGICGTAMGNVALLLKEQGHHICGSDAGVYPPMSDLLARSEIEVFEGFDAGRLAKLPLDLVVVGNAMSRGNPEIEWLLEQSAVPFVSLPALCQERLLQDRLPVVIAGTHGKTTTSALTAFLLRSAGKDPGWLIGGVPKDLPGGSHLGSGHAFVIEGDEYDSAFFDKRSKCIHYRPRIAVLNNLEFDHADIFRDLADVQRTFSHFLRIIPRSGYALINGDDPNLQELLPISWTRCLTVGRGEENDLRILDFRDGAKGASFSLVWKGKIWAKVDWKLHGIFNARNAAMAALAAALASGMDDPRQFDLSALAEFRGVQRRQDLLFDNAKWTVLEDFAHHPTAVAAAVEALHAAYPDRTIHVCFEPRSNTAAGAYFQREFTAALANADRVYLAPVHRAERMRPNERLDTVAMAADLSNGGCRSVAYDSNEALLESLKSIVTEEACGLVVFFSNGSFDGVQQQLVQLLESKVSS